MRNNPDLGAAAFPAGIAVLGQADPAKNHVHPFFTSHPLRFDGELLAVRERNPSQSWK